MKANTRKAQGRGHAGLARVSFILVATAVVCLMTAGVVWASVPETSQRAIQAPPVTSQTDFQQAKTMANTDAGWTVQAPATVATGSESSSSGTALTVGLVLAAVAACALVVFSVQRRRHVGKPAVAAGPIAAIGVGREHRKAA
jgi:hypothetical protein